MAYEERKRPPLSHSISLEHREKLSITGVDEVESFDENAICLLTSAGYLTISGSELHIEKLNLDGGELLVVGTVDGIVYEERNSRKDGLLRRLFRP